MAVAKPWKNAIRLAAKLGHGVASRVQAYATFLDALAEIRGAWGLVAKTGADSAALWGYRSDGALPTDGDVLTYDSGTTAYQAQPLSTDWPDLAAIEGLSTTGIACRTAADTWTTRTITASGGVTISNGGGVAGAPAIATDGILEDLNTLGAATAAGQVPVATAAGVYAHRAFLGARKTATTTRTNTTTLADDPHLTIANVPAGSYQFLLILDQNADTADPDIKLKWSLPASSTALWGRMDAQVGSFTESTTRSETLTPGALVTPYGGTINVATAGTVALQWAQNTLDAVDGTILGINSSLYLWPIS